MGSDLEREENRIREDRDRSKAGIRHHDINRGNRSRGGAEMVDSEWKETDRGDRFRGDSHRMHRLRVESNSGDSPQVGVTEHSQ